MVTLFIFVLTFKINNKANKNILLLFAHNYINNNKYSTITYLHNKFKVFMKKVFFTVSILILGATNAPSVHANDISLRLCEYVQANDKNRLRSFLKQNKIKIRNFYDDLACNGDNLLVFAAKSNALEVGKFIIGNLPAKKVQNEIDAIAKHSVALAEEAKNR